MPMFDLLKVFIIGVVLHFVPFLLIVTIMFGVADVFKLVSYQQFYLIIGMLSVAGGVVMVLTKILINILHKA